MIPDDNPDRSQYYQDERPSIILKQLNDAWKQMRLFEKAVSDRDRNLDRLHGSIRERDKTIETLHTALRIHNRMWPLIYAIAGGMAAKFTELLVRWFT